MTKPSKLVTAVVPLSCYVLSLIAMYPIECKAQGSTPNVVIQWNNAALQGVRNSKLGPPMVARALAIVHTCIYDAWAAYDDSAIGTQLGPRLRQPPRQRNRANREKAISFAAYRATVDLFPQDKAQVFDLLMATLGYDPNDRSLDASTPSGVGNVACAAVLNFRHHDGSNQLGNLTPGGIAYADYTGYTPINRPSTVPVNPANVVNVDRWQPLQYVNGGGVFITQTCIGPFWGKVTPFALTSADQFRHMISEGGPVTFTTPGFVKQAMDLIRLSANLTDEQKMIAEYWADGPNSELPPGHWDLFAQFVSNRDRHQLDTDVKMFFALTNAIFDGSIVAWNAKRTFDSVRPVTAIPFLFHGQRIRAWAGPYAGTQIIDGGNWIPYQPSTFPTPPFPEFISGHSTFSAAGAEVLRLFTRSDYFGGSVIFAAGSSKIESGATPAHSLSLYWRSFTDAADQAGISRRYGGIHFEAGDLTGRVVGGFVGRQALAKARSFWRGSDSEDSDH